MQVSLMRFGVRNFFYRDEKWRNFVYRDEKSRCGESVRSGVRKRRNCVYPGPFLMESGWMKYGAKRLRIRDLLNPLVRGSVFYS